MVYPRHDTLQRHCQHPENTIFQLCCFSTKLGEMTACGNAMAKLVLMCSCKFLFKYLTEQESDQWYNVKIYGKVYDRNICINKNGKGSLKS